MNNVKTWTMNKRENVSSQYTFESIFNLTNNH